MPDSLVQQYCEKNNIHSFEGARGVTALEGLLQTLGYGKVFMRNRAIEDFLADNPGAIEALVNFIEEALPGNQEWADALTHDA